MEIIKREGQWLVTKYLLFCDEGPIGKNRKTRKYTVRSAFSNAFLGIVKWMPNWRQYAFFANDAIFDKTCLRDLADFCELMTYEHRMKAYND